MTLLTTLAENATPPPSPQRWRCFGLANCGATQKWILILISIWKLVLLLAIRTVFVASIRCVDSIYVVCRIHAHTHTQHTWADTNDKRSNKIMRKIWNDSPKLNQIVWWKYAKREFQIKLNNVPESVGWMEEMEMEDFQGFVGDVHATLISHFTAKTTNTENRDVGIFLFHDVEHTR